MGILIIRRNPVSYTYAAVTVFGKLGLISHNVPAVVIGRIGQAAPACICREQRHVVFRQGEPYALAKVTGGKPSVLHKAVIIIMDANHIVSGMQHICNVIFIVLIVHGISVRRALPHILTVDPEFIIIICCDPEAI